MIIETALLCHKHSSTEELIHISARSELRESAIISAVQYTNLICLLPLERCIYVCGLIKKEEHLIFAKGPRKYLGTPTRTSYIVRIKPLFFLDMCVSGRHAKRFFNNF